MEENRFQCKLCPKSFTARSNLSRHYKDGHGGPPQEKNCAGATPFYCLCCGLSFVNRTSLRNHSHKKHGGNWLVDSGNDCFIPEEIPADLEQEQEQQQQQQQPEQLQQEQQEQQQQDLLGMRDAHVHEEEKEKKEEEKKEEEKKEEKKEESRCYICLEADDLDALLCCGGPVHTDCFRLQQQNPLGLGRRSSSAMCSLCKRHQIGLYSEAQKQGLSSGLLKQINEKVAQHALKEQAVQQQLEQQKDVATAEQLKMVATAIFTAFGMRRNIVAAEEIQKAVESSEKQWGRSRPAVGEGSFLHSLDRIAALVPEWIKVSSTPQGRQIHRKEKTMQLYHINRVIDEKLGLIVIPTPKKRSRPEQVPIDTLLQKVGLLATKEQGRSEGMREALHQVSSSFGGGEENSDQELASGVCSQEVTEIMQEVTSSNAEGTSIDFKSLPQQEQAAIKESCHQVKCARRRTLKYNEKCAALARNATAAYKKLYAKEKNFSKQLLSHALGNRMKVGHRLGQGGFGMVYRCTPVTNKSILQLPSGKRPQEDVALKVSIGQAEELVSEVECLHKIKESSAVNSQFVMVPLDILEVAGHVAYTMPLMSYTLHDIAPKLNIEQKRYVACYICRGIVAGHKAGISHQDIKPANILFDEKYVPKVSDWGLAGGVKGAGTGKWMAPEHFDGTSKSINHFRADAWACGLVLCYLFEGKFAFSERTLTLVQCPNPLADPLPLHFTAATPAPAQDLITKLLVVDPKKRWMVQQAVSHPFFNGISVLGNVLLDLTEVQPASPRDGDEEKNMEQIQCSKK